MYKISKGKEKEPTDRVRFFAERVRNYLRTTTSFQPDQSLVLGPGLWKTRGSKGRKKKDPGASLDCVPRDPHPTSVHSARGRRDAIRRGGQCVKDLARSVCRRCRESTF